MYTLSIYCSWSNNMRNAVHYENYILKLIAYQCSDPCFNCNNMFMKTWNIPSPVFIYHSCWISNDPCFEVSSANLSCQYLMFWFYMSLEIKTSELQTFQAFFRIQGIFSPVLAIWIHHFNFHCKSFLCTQLDCIK